jgi:hypothetical protein
MSTTTVRAELVEALLAIHRPFDRLRAIGPFDKLRPFDRLRAIGPFDKLRPFDRLRAIGPFDKLRANGCRGALA